MRDSKGCFAINFDSQSGDDFTPNEKWWNTHLQFWINYSNQFLVAGLFEIYQDHIGTQHNVMLGDALYHYAEFHYAECCGARNSLEEHAYSKATVILKLVGWSTGTL